MFNFALMFTYAPRRASAAVRAPEVAAVSVAPRRATSRIDAMLAQPPSPEELAELARGPEIVVDGNVSPADAARARAFVVGMLRAAAAIRFDVPMPITGVTRMMDYLRAQVSRIHVYRDDVSSDGTWRAVLTDSQGRPVREITMGATHIGSPDRWDEGASQVIVLMHEARHLEDPALGHNCAADCSVCVSDLYARSLGIPGGPGVRRDPSLAFGGAYAVHYYTASWLADHSGDWLSAAQREQLRESARRVTVNSTCEGRTPTMLRMPSEI